MNHEQFLMEEERKSAITRMKNDREHAALRAKLVEKYGEEPMQRKEEQLRKIYA
jgi:hypothetical protein